MEDKYKEWEEDWPKRYHQEQFGMKNPQILRSGLLSFRADLVALLNKQTVQIEALEILRSKYDFLKEK
jgi:hypothetical protein